MECRASIIKIEETNNSKIKQEIHFELINTNEKTYTLNEVAEVEGSYIHNYVKEEDRNKDTEFVCSDLCQVEEEEGGRTMIEYSSSITKIKEENNSDIKQEEVNFEFIDTYENRYLLGECKTDVEESYMPNDIKEEVEDESNTMEFVNVQVNQEDERTEQPIQETDPLATSFAKEINVEQMSIKKQDITDTSGSTSQDLHCPANASLRSVYLAVDAHQHYNLHSKETTRRINYVEHVSPCSEQELCTDSENPPTEYGNTGNNGDKGIVCPDTVPQSLPIKLEKVVHNEKKVLKCTLCDYTCGKKSQLKQHTKSHPREKPYKCTVCDYSGNQSGQLKQHMRLHTGEKPYKCTVCGHCCSQLGNLKQHMRLHTGEKPYKCTVCDLSCNQSGQLKKHMRLHTGEKPYKCTICDFSFSQSFNLKQHIKLHTGEKPYKCTVCSYSCVRPGHLKQHMRLHTGEKPYKCVVCDFCCIRPYQLKQHMKLHTGEKPY